MLDGWEEIRRRQSDPNFIGWNEVVMPLESSNREGVEALFILNDDNTNNTQSISPAREYDYYAAKQLSERDYNGAPVVVLNPTAENALKGELFSCDF